MENLSNYVKTTQIFHRTAKTRFFLGHVIFSVHVQGVPKVRSSYFTRHNFSSKLYFYIKFLKDVYYSIEYMYSEVQYPACPLLFLITFCSRCGMEWDKSYRLDSGIVFQACMSRLFMSFMVLEVGFL